MLNNHNPKMYFAHVVLAAVLLEVVVTNPVSYLQPLSAEDAQRLEKWTPEDEPMWQLSGQFEGDIVLTPQQRNGVVNTKLRWPNRVIPYEITGDFPENEKTFIRDILAREYGRTCIKVRARTASDTDYVSITGKNTGCWSMVGRVGGRQELNLQRNGCLWENTVAHEMLHAAGFYHQQSATERDSWVTIMWENIQAGKEHNFNKYGSNVISSFGEKYDYGSIMHYGATAFSKNGQKTIVPKQDVQIGVAKVLSAIDIRKLNKMYNC